MTAIGVLVRNPDVRSGGIEAEFPPGGGPVQPGRLCVERLPRLAHHRGTPPDLVMRWSALPGSGPLDVVVHLHGHSPRGVQMNLVRDMLPVSGLDLTDPAHPGPAGPVRPILLLLPRGHFFGGRSGRGYTFPAL